MTDRFNAFVFGKSTKTGEAHIWGIDPASPNLLMQTGYKPLTVPPNANLTPIGNYLLVWTANDEEKYFDYALFSLKGGVAELADQQPVQSGRWEYKKFFHGHLDFGHYGNKHRDSANPNHMKFIPMTNSMLAWSAEPARGNFHLWNFDPGLEDPLDYGLNTDGAWGKIQLGHELIGMGNYVLDWQPDTGEYAVWSFDPQLRDPLKLPYVNQGRWSDIGADHQLVAIDKLILDWVPRDGSFRVWRFDAKAENPLGEAPIHGGQLPDGLDPDTVLTGVIPNMLFDDQSADQPGTRSYMQKKIKHVVYYMVENRSFDHVCGWLYNNKDKVPAQIIGSQGPFKGADKDMFNVDAGGEKVALYQYNDGDFSPEQGLEYLSFDPHHNHSDVMRQLFSPDGEGYYKQATPDMGGFVINNAEHSVMGTYTPEQIPVLSGLAENFAVSDEWFCSMPGGTDVNRAFSLTGSSFGRLDNFQNGALYAIWHELPHRPSIWKTLWSNGIDDWKIYNSTAWFSMVFSYNLFLEGQIPSIDKAIAKAAGKVKPKPSEEKLDTPHLAYFPHFIDDCKKGTLPAFSFIEPIWIAINGTTSYHPGGDLAPGEKQLAEIFDALQSSPCWDETLLVITFDEHGGIFDHVPPPYAVNPWPNDKNNGFEFDILGVRVPTILVSPMIEKNTVFRADDGQAYDATSFPATLLEWFGVPKSRWGLGDRTDAAPTFENVITRETPRTDKVHVEAHHDAHNPVDASKIEPHDLHRITAHRTIMDIGAKHIEPSQLAAQANDISESSQTLKELCERIEAFESELPE